MAAEKNIKRKTPAKTAKPAAKRSSKKAAAKSTSSTRKKNVKASADKSPSTKKKAPARKTTAKAKEPAKVEKSAKSPLDSPEFQPIVRDLIRLAKEQEYLTFDDINEALPDTQSDLELMEELIERLRGMKFRIIDGAEVDNVKAGSDDDEEAAPAKPAQEK